MEKVRAWVDDYLEDQLELADEVKARLDQSCREITEGRYTIRPLTKHPLAKQTTQS